KENAHKVANRQSVDSAASSRFASAIADNVCGQSTAYAPSARQAIASTIPKMRGSTNLATRALERLIGIAITNASVARIGFYLRTGFCEKHRNPVRIGIIELIVADTQCPQPALDLLGCMLPCIVRIIPIEVDHVIRFKIEGFVPKALNEVIIQKPLDVVRAGRNAEDLDGLCQRNRRIEAAQFASHFGQRPANFEARVRR